MGIENIKALTTIISAIGITVSLINLIIYKFDLFHSEITSKNKSNKMIDLAIFGIVVSIALLIIVNDL